MTCQHFFFRILINQLFLVGHGLVNLVNDSIYVWHNLAVKAPLKHFWFKKKKKSATKNCHLLLDLLGKCYPLGVCISGAVHHSSHILLQTYKNQALNQLVGEGSPIAAELQYQ